MISKESVGVEVSKDKLTISYVKATPFNTKIYAYASHDLDAKSRFSEKMDTISTLVKHFLHRYHIGTACIWIGLPAEMVILRVIGLPSAAKENLTKALEYELQKYIPLESEDIYFRYQILDEDRDEKRLKILVAAVKKKDLAPLIELRNRFGTGIYGVESAATAGINGLKWASESIVEKAYGLAYTAGSTLHLGFFENDKIRFMRSLDLDDDLKYQSERLLQEFDYLGNLSSDSNSGPALKVYCQGPDATEDLLLALNTLPNLEFSLLNLNQGTFKEGNPISGTGLAIKSIQRVPLDINLFPEQFRKKPSVIGRYLTLMLVVLTVVAGLAWGASHFMHQRVAIMQIDKELNELSDEIDALGQVQQKIVTLQERINYINNLRQYRVNALNILKELTEILPETAWLQGLSVADNRVEIEGYADYSTQLIPQLEASPFFANAKFISTITRARDGKEVFKIGFEISRQTKDEKQN